MCNPAFPISLCPTFVFPTKADANGDCPICVFCLKQFLRAPTGGETFCEICSRRCTTCNLRMSYLAQQSRYIAHQNRCQIRTAASHWERQPMHLECGRSPLIGN